MRHWITESRRDDLKHLEGKSVDIGEWFAMVLKIPASATFIILSSTKKSITFFTEALGNFSIPKSALKFEDDKD